jgi:hypothetical protein
VFDVCRERGREREGGEREQERPGALGRERGRESERHTQTAEGRERSGVIESDRGRERKKEGKRVPVCLLLT